MKIAHIVPTGNLELIANRGYHMALAGRLKRDTEYFQFYASLGQLDAFIIVDNGAAEGEAVPFEEVKDLADQIGASEIVLPDVLYDMPRTLKRLDQEWVHVASQRRMLVPQGADIQDYEYCLHAMRQIPHASIGINRALLKWNESLRRERVIKRLITEGETVHLLGAWEYPLLELELWRGYAGVRGTDTGIAAAYSQHELLLDKWKGHISLNHDLVAPERFLLKNIEIMEQTQWMG